MFGNKPARNIYAIKKDIIICEAPNIIQGQVPVRVSLDCGRTFIETEATFSCIDPMDVNALQNYVSVLKMCSLQQMYQTQPVYTVNRWSNETSLHQRFKEKVNLDE